METFSGSSNWRLTIRREAAGVTLMRAVTCDVRAALPETLFGLPVTALGDHAMAPGAPPVQGEELLVTCGAPREAEWDNRNLRELTLPLTLARIEDYALMDCRRLRALCLRDGTQLRGGGTLMNCRSLDTFHLIRNGEQGQTLADLADELPWELDVTITGAGEPVRLIFPEYQEIYEENCPAHHFDYNISGAGYPYHHSFRNKRLDLREYDELWPAFLGTEHDRSCAIRMAFWRLRYPAELSDRAREAYWSYLRANRDPAAMWLVGAGDVPGLAFLLREAPLEGEGLCAVCALARERGNTGALALLLEQRRDAAPRGLDKTFDL